ncbi:TadC protein [Gemmatimonadetes bacterium T265]|nr:TadC protein [Gemmatimonadetes bacterium T265]
MMLTLVAFVGLLAAAAGAAAYALLAERQRRTVLARAGGFGANALVLQAPRAGVAERLTRQLARRLPTRWAARGAITQTLVHAGFDGASAPLVYTAARVAAVTIPPLLALVLAPRDNRLYYVALVACAAVAGLLGPAAVVQNLARGRQERLQRQLPDCLDLLVVCVEAGVSLDAAMMRVARELATVHPELSAELLQVTRRVNAGVAREQALHGMYQRTGVQELRALVANMIQSEKWGTSIATVLRVYAEGLRRRRKQAAEKKAATSPLKMMIPLALFIFPVIFVVLLGPAILKMGDLFENTH